MESRKELLNKATDAYIHIFTGTRHQRKKHINDNEYLITKVESELRLINVGVITSLILMVTLMVLIVVIFFDSFTIRNFNTNTTTNPLAIFQTQKLYIIYTNGLVLDFQLTKNMQFQELESQNFPMITAVILVSMILINYLYFWEVKTNWDTIYKIH